MDGGLILHGSLVRFVDMCSFKAMHIHGRRHEPHLRSYSQRMLGDGLVKVPDAPRGGN